MRHVFSQQELGSVLYRATLWCNGWYQQQEAGTGPKKPVVHTLKTRDAKPASSRTTVPIEFCPGEAKMSPLSPELNPPWVPPPFPSVHSSLPPSVRPSLHPSLHLSIPPCPGSSLTDPPLQYERSIHAIISFRVSRLFSTSPAPAHVIFCTSHTKLVTLCSQVQHSHVSPYYRSEAPVDPGSSHLTLETNPPAQMVWHQPHFQCHVSIFCWWKLPLPPKV